MAMMKLPADVEKEVVAQGRPHHRGLLPPYPPGTKIEFHFQSLLEGADVAIDDTRKMGKPMTLVIGKQFKMEVWELMLNTMIPGQVARYKVPSSYVTCYPLVSKAVRDSMKPPSEDGSHGSGHHCCGMMSQGIGYADLDKLMEKPQPMTFLFEMLEVQGPGDYEVESWQLSEGEKLASVPKLQAEGNKLFANGDFGGAEKKYFEAIARIEQLLLRERPGEEESDVLEDQKMPLLLNYALCLMKRQEYYEAIQHLTTVLTRQTKNVKGLFRRGKCHQSVGNFKEAREDFEKAGSLDPTLTPAVGKILLELSTAEREQDLKDKQKFKRIFNDL